MTDVQQEQRGGWRRQLDHYAALRPDLVLMTPFMVYLLLLSVQEVVPYEWRWAAIALRGLGALLVFSLLARHMPPAGRPFVGLAVIAGILAAAGWAAGQHYFNSVGIPQRLPLPLFPGAAEIVNPADKLGDGLLLWTTIVLRIAVACTVVPIVEEYFWRGFMLRALVNWNDFEKVPPGTFTWVSFLGTSLLSTLQHPDNWLVSILCWMFFNGLYYWTRSIRCLIIVHAVTNLVLYVYMVARPDWLFW